MGKGGVGRTTVAAALGLVAARRGRRPIVCEMCGRARVDETGVDLATISVDPEQAKLEWLERQLRSRRLARLLGRNRIFELLTAAAPGLAELVAIGKVWDLADAGRLAEGDRANLQVLTRRLRRKPMIEVPELDEEVHDLEGLQRVGGHLFGTGRGGGDA